MTFTSHSIKRAFEEPKRVCCAIGKCLAKVEKGQVMCLEHWTMVPFPLKREIGFTYRAREMRNYQDALRRAVDHIETETGLYTGIFEKRAARAPAARTEGGDFPPVAPPSKPVRVRRPRLTLKRLIAIQEALAFRLSDELGDEAESQSAYEGAEEWAAGEIAKRQIRINARRS